MYTLLPQLRLLRASSSDNCFVMLTRDLADFFREHYYDVLRQTNIRAGTWGGSWRTHLTDWVAAFREHGYPVILRGANPPGCFGCLKRSGVRVENAYADKIEGPSVYGGKNYPGSCEERSGNGNSSWWYEYKPSSFKDQLRPQFRASQVRFGVPWPFELTALASQSSTIGSANLHTASP